MLKEVNIIIYTMYNISTKSKEICLLDNFFAVTMLLRKKFYSRHMTGGTWMYKNFKTNVNSDNKISYLAMTDTIWNFFHVCNPHIQLYCSPHKCLFLTNLAPHKRVISMFSNIVRFYCQKHC